MNTSTKALLLSALVYPGAGHFYLKKPVQGILFSAITSVCLYFLLVTVVKMAQEISDKILSGEISVDVIELTEAILKILEDSGIHQINVTTIALLVCWLLSIFDSYRLGRRGGRKLEGI
ncbi:MAG: hypothetical protein HND53_12175 [Proteobacteria bacterium]|nr:hypothetical protein [Pseudomonadota bacterium]NOG61251.1 hypothetical protein [Pseudomonadota bacterium]